MSYGRGVARQGRQGGGRPDPHVERLLRMLGAATPVDWSRAGIGERRAGFDGLMRFAASPLHPATVEDRTMDGPGGVLRLRLYGPQTGHPAMPGLVYFHGGGLVAGSLASYESLCGTLAGGLGCRLVAVDYRLAPEHPFPAAVEDAEAAVRHVLDRAADFGLDPARVSLGGDSAGGTLAAVTAQSLRGAGDRRLRAQFLLCPVLDAVGERPSRRTYGEGFLLDAAMMARDLAHYRPDLPAADPRLSPLRAARFDGLPPAVIHTAECDPLADEGQAYAEALRAAGVSVTHRCHAGMVHHFYGLTALVPTAREALAAAMADMTALL